MAQHGSGHHRQSRNPLVAIARGATRPHLLDLRFELGEGARGVGREAIESTLGSGDRVGPERQEQLSDRGGVDRNLCPHSRRRSQEARALGLVQHQDSPGAGAAPAPTWSP